MDKRVAIYVTFNKNGIIPEYVWYSLNNLERSVDHLFLVINGTGTVENSILSEKTTVIARPNVGYDGMAFKRIIVNEIGEECLNQYEELLLINDSFLGPFISWNKIFEKFTSDDIDFYGFTKWIEGETALLNNKNITEHVQGYFVGIKKRILEDRRFYAFWETLPDIFTYNEAIEYYEIGLSKYLMKCGYHFKVWTDFYAEQDYLLPEDNVYISHPVELINDYEFPILKKKGINLYNYSKIKTCLSQICNGVFISFMEEILAELFAIHSTTFGEVEDFLDHNRHFYIYGHGEIARILTEYLNQKGVKIERYIVSCNANYEKHEILASEYIAQNGDGIFIALSEKNFLSAEKIIKRYISEANLLRL